MMGERSTAVCPSDRFRNLAGKLKKKFFSIEIRERSVNDAETATERLFRGFQWLKRVFAIEGESRGPLRLTLRLIAQGTL